MGVSLGVVARNCASSCGSRTCCARTAATCSGPCPLQQPGGAGKRMKRKIGRHRQEPQGRDRRSGFERRGQRIAQFACPANFLLVVEKHIFVDETLARERGIKFQRPCHPHASPCCRVQQQTPRHGEKALEFDVGVLRRNQQRQEQFVVRQSLWAPDRTIPAPATPAARPARPAPRRRRSARSA